MLGVLAVISPALGPNLHEAVGESTGNRIRKSNENGAEKKSRNDVNDSKKYELKQDIGQDSHQEQDTNGIEALSDGVLPPALSGENAPQECGASFLRIPFSGDDSQNHRSHRLDQKTKPTRANEARNHVAPKTIRKQIKMASLNPLLEHRRKRSG